MNVRHPGFASLVVRTGAWLILLACSAVRARAAAARYVWIEGEQPTSSNIKWISGGTSHPDWMSGTKWLTFTADPDHVEQAIPADGGLIEYAFSTADAGKQEVWARIGFEFARAAFDWKIDAGAWTSVSPEELTTDAMEIEFFAEAAWLKLATAELPAGKHTLTFRIPRTKNAAGKYNNVLFGLDAICISADPFVPHSRYKPDENWRTDKDDQAAKQVFALPAAKDASERSSVTLSGLWEICRNDEQKPGDVATPIKEFPGKPFWGAIEVPGDRNEKRPDLLFAHRFWYRTRVSVPAELAGRAFVLVFPQNNLNTTVYVNGVLCGFDKNPFARVQIDVTKGIKPGQVNELWVGMRDAWYGRANDPENPMKLRRTFNLPTNFLNSGFQDMDYPVWSHAESGILQPPTMTAAGSLYASDVFVKTSLSKKQIAADVTVTNSSAKDASGQLVCEAIDPKTGAVAKKLAAKAFTIAAGKEQVVDVAEAWADAKLWWPDQPNLYTLRTSVVVDGKSTDTTETTFGFREWTIDGIHFKLNGVNYRAWCDQHVQDTKEKWLEFHRKTHQQVMRFWGTTWQGMSAEDALSFFDKSGVPVRRSGVFDGEAIGYHADEPDEKLRKRNNSDIKLDLLRNWRDQVVAQVKGERNHPSIMIWSIENEWLFINCINLYGGLMDAFEVEETKTSNAVLAADPTRPTMSDGGAACKLQTLPVCGNHYITGTLPEYPTLAYSANVKGGGRGRWEWDRKRPRFVGEDWFIAGNHPELAYLGGEAALTGKAGSLPAAGLSMHILQEGYRWADYGGWDFWCGQADADGSQYNSFSPRAILFRWWNWTFGSGQEVAPPCVVFNDTHYSDPIHLDWQFTIGGKVVSHGARDLHVVAGEREELKNLELQMPVVSKRTEGELVLKLSVAGEEVFKDVKVVSVLPTSTNQAKPAPLAGLKASDLLVCDPGGDAAAFLKARGIGFTALQDLQALPETGRVLLVGKDAIAANDRTSSRFAAWAAGGRTVIVLEQKTPLQYGALPAEIQSATNVGRTAFLEDSGHAAVAGLDSKDFFTWIGSSADDEVVYRNAYLKPTRGAKSLIECDEFLKASALVEVPVDKGLMLLSQLVLEEKLAASATAQQLLLDLINYGADYKLTFRPATVTAADNTPLARTVAAIGLTHTAAVDPLEAIAQPTEKICVVEATPANLKSLAANPAKVDAFTAAGGWIVLNGLTPDGLADYNKLVGFDHMIRPFRREHVTFAPVRNHLTAGIPAGDVAMYSSKQIFPWQAGNYVVEDEFAWCVDYDEVAPFAKWNNDFYYNLVNGFVTADGWPFIVNVPPPASGPLDMVMTFPKPQTITEFTWIGNTLYWPTTKVNLIFDDKAADAASYKVDPNNLPQVLPVNPPQTGTKITLQLAEWTKLPNIGANIGGDNIYLKAARPPQFYETVKPMLNVGGMMEYPRGKGGIVLCNLLFKDTEEVPENLLKKRSIFATLLRNLKAPFTGGRTVIVGTPLQYTPVDLSKQANQFRTERGWFGDKNFTFADLPVGRQTFAGVPFDVFEFATSPVPTAVMLGGAGVPGNLPEAVKGIPVGRKADALFFLQTARLDRRRNEQEVKDNKRLEMAKYVIHYADGKSESVPVYSEIDIENYRQADPHPLPGAQLAWTKKYEKSVESAAAFVQQWNNPRPDVAIQTVDLEYGPDKTGVPVLLALTAASAK